MKPVDVKDNTYPETMELHSNEDPKFKVDDHVRISKYKNIFTKGYTSNWSEKVFMNKNVKNTVPWTYVINGLNGDEIIGTFCEIELQKTNQFYVKWKGYDSSFNSWIDKKDLPNKCNFIF